ncbi:LLM class flavin-dependent oxidoreductase [Ktedonosporobacter rubrisoli]|uniref:LLM class flavin-dependent oxidoreductase n=1 Tax=Ktedonosporobacter rubrisoli TaxID=2509675 RepID=A0A4P6K4V1_KTERU|nr:LLM class flavin-dependent oxidoreductase [Ktedonosporobacter rubrisoli]QBD83244.1 LLM class flavin-dependent oxidoreductase [Ktedonosporobacter rubrisoli]
MSQVSEHSQITSEPLPLRDRVGIFLQPTTATDALSQIREAEQAGIRQIWLDWGAGFAETLTLLAAAAVQTDQIRLGTAIIPAAPRHPVVMAQQMLALHDLAPGRFRFGIGAGHRPLMKRWYGASLSSPQSYLKEFLEILRRVLWEGSIEHQGTFFQVVVDQAMYPHPRRAQVPLLISAIGKKAFWQAGEIADGALSALCPIPYLLQEALPALRAGAEAAGRPVLPLIAHIPVALTTDDAAALAVMRPWVQAATQLDTFSSMLKQAGWEEAIKGDERALETLTRTLLIWGDEAMVRRRLQELLGLGLDELTLQLMPVANAVQERRLLFQLVGAL